MTDPIIVDVTFKVDALTPEQYANLFSRDQELAVGGEPYPLTQWLADITPARGIEVYQFAGKNVVEFNIAVAAILDFQPQVPIVAMIIGYANGMSLTDLDALALQSQPLEERPNGCKWNALLA